MVLDTILTTRQSLLFSVLSMECMRQLLQCFCTVSFIILLTVEVYTRVVDNYI